jgi:hypothetical protein
MYVEKKFGAVNILLIYKQMTFKRNLVACDSYSIDQKMRQKGPNFVDDYIWHY